MFNYFSRKEREGIKEAQLKAIEEAEMKRKKAYLEEDQHNIHIGEQANVGTPELSGGKFYPVLKRQMYRAAHYVVLKGYRAFSGDNVKASRRYYYELNEIVDHRTNGMWYSGDTIIEYFKTKKEAQDYADQWNKEHPLNDVTLNELNSRAEKDWEKEMEKQDKENDRKLSFFDGSSEYLLLGHRHEG